MDKIKKYINRAVKILSLKELSILPSYLAYNLVLAIIPIITIITLIVGVFSISLDNVIDFINELFPVYISEVIVGAISGDNFDVSIGVLNFTILVVASNGMYAIVNASNNLYRVESSSKISDRFRSFVILIILILLLIFMIIVPMLGDVIIDFIRDYIENISVTQTINLVYNSLKWPISFILIFLAIKGIYIIAPSVKIKGEDTTIGAFITTIGWIIFTALFGYYISLFGKYDIIYGGLSSVIIFLIWFYVLSFILILGIVINASKYNKLY